MFQSLDNQIHISISTENVMYDNMLLEWGEIPYAELSILLVYLRYLATVHQTHHWISKGDPFYGDHILFQRLYDGVNAEIDTIAEKAVGLGSEQNVNLCLQANQLAKFASKYDSVAATIPGASELAKKSLSIETDFMNCVKHCVQSLKEKNLLTRGLDNLLAGIEDKHESHIYLLKQRCGA